MNAIRSVALASYGQSFVDARPNLVGGRAAMNVAKQLAIMVPLIVALPGNASAQQDDDVAGVVAASDAFYEALATIDDGTAMNGVVAHTPYITLAGPRAEDFIVGIDGWKAYWPAANKLFATRDVVLSEQQIHVDGNLAWEVGSENGTAMMANGEEREVKNLVTNVYEKIDGEWLMVSHHAQPVPR